MSTFRLATFNIENLEWARTHEDAFSRRIAALRPILRELSADILCLQEVGAQRATAHAPRRFHALDRLLADGPYAGFDRATSTRPGGDRPADVHNLAILSRWPISAHRQIHHDIVAKWSWTPPQGSPVDVVFDRPLLHACIELPDATRLHVLNLHLRAPRPVPLAEAPSGRALAEGQFLAAQRREAQALEARLVVEELFDRESGARIAVCGDLNADEFDAPTRILTGEGARRLEPLEARVPASERFSIIHAGKPMQVDQILASKALAQSCTEVAILNRDLQDEAFAPEPIVGSLHAPVVAAFRMSGSAP